MRAPLAASILLLLVAPRFPARAAAQIEEIVDALPDIPRAAATSGQVDESDLVVTARRRGEAEVGAEAEYDESQIAAQGVDSIQDLLTRLAPFLGKGGNSPIILINGRPAGFDRSVLAYPVEALSRLAVLKPEASATYGDRVVNLVLKRRFSSLAADASASWATAGGQQGAAFSIGRTAISGDTRWNFQARLSRDSALLKSARTIPKPAGIFDGVGYVSGVGGGEIDPALSAAAGKIVTVAAISAGATSATPGIDDFAATANQGQPVDPNLFDSLQPSRRAIAVNAGITRPLGAFSVTLDLSASSNRAQGLHGLPMASVVIPARSPWSPFAGDVMLIRPFSGARALRTVSTARALGASLSVTGAVGGWQTSFAFSYMRNWSDNILEHGIDVARIQQLIDAEDKNFNPYGHWDAGLLLVTRARARRSNLGARLNIQKRIADMPAGALAWSFVADISRVGVDDLQGGRADTVAARDKVTSSQLNARMSLAVPLSRHGPLTNGWLGDWSVDMWVAGQAMSGTGLQRSFGGGLNWAPIDMIRLGAALEHADVVPSFDQLEAPLVTTVARVFDYTRRQVAEPIWTTGGNPGLQRGSRRTFTVSALLQPLGNQDLMLNLNYRRTVASAGGQGFPELSPAVEAAFPDRVTRDVSGQLIAVDARAINIVRDIDTSLLSGVALHFVSGGRDALQFTLSLNHNWRLKSETLIRPGVPVIDRLGGGGMSRHMLDVQLAAGKRGMGASVNMRWSGQASIDQGAGNDALRIRPPVILDASAFIDLDRYLPEWKGRKLGKNLNISLSIANLLNGYSHVRLQDGRAPAGFSRDEIDPLGRTIRLAVRKRF